VTATQAVVIASAPQFLFGCLKKFDGCASAKRFQPESASGINMPAGRVADGGADGVGQAIGACRAKAGAFASPSAEPPTTSPCAGANSSISTSPEAERIRVVLDNLSTHAPGALYAALLASEARRLLSRIEFHYTPKHASWLNMVEIEIGVLKRQCLDRRIDDRDRLVAEIAAWQRQRNHNGARIKWTFSTKTARKLSLRPRYLSRSADKKSLHHKARSCLQLGDSQISN